ncbi:kinase-like domain-containing protein [Ilyonectria robusta]|uniref:kinase-like domain-containing protein n=1 Tax=Ilyonectria robusta TaxID=1079257 RepID=UPI001E8CCB5C|nr:kinase-like domain-containing protein [Ilyonectria robusta]KAH8662767.1 kinase-like domain-containing protein [Ilyonectria robusta]
MGAFSSRDNNEPYRPCVYKEDGEIPFAPDGNAPLICDCVEKVKGTSGHFKGLKCVRKTIIVPTEADQVSREAKKRKLIQEAKILHLARHHHVIQLIHTYFEDGNEDQIKFAVIMDRADANLHHYLKPGKIPSRKWFSCLIGVMHYIHTLGIRHRDIKPSNILIKGEKVLLADFGISQMGLGKTMPTTYRYRNAPRTREYCAPEVEKGSTRGRSADIFSLGAVFLEMLLAHSYPSGFQELEKVLKPPSQHVSSYANHIDDVHTWVGQSLHLVGWQDDILSTCRRMLHPDRLQRPRAEDLDSDLSSLSASDESMACKCARDVALTESNKLVEACRRGSEDEVKRLLYNGADPNTIGAIHHAAEPLQCAARDRSEDVVKLLLEKGADVNAKDENDQTALQGAAGQGYENIVKMLLESGADVDAEDLDGNTALHFADRRHHSVVLDLLENYVITEV